MKSSFLNLLLSLCCTVPTSIFAQNNERGADVESTRVALTLASGYDWPIGQTGRLARASGIRFGGPTVAGRVAVGRNDWIIYPVATLSAGYGKWQFDRSLVRIGFGIGPGFRMPVGRAIEIVSAITGGFSAGFYETESNPDVEIVLAGKGTFGIDFRLGRSLMLGAYATASYASDFLTFAGVNINASYVGEINRATLQTAIRDGDLVFEALDFEPIFPILHNQYDKRPLGTFRIKNGGSTSITSLSVDFSIPRYTLTARNLGRNLELEPGASMEFPVTAVLTDSVLDVTEGTVVEASVVAAYEQYGFDQQTEYTESVTVLHRNAMTWDDDEKACAFVTKNDPAVNAFARNVSSAIRDSEIAGVAPNFAKAMAIYEAIRAHGMVYEIDQTTP